MFKRENIKSAAWAFGAFVWKTGLLIFLFFGGMMLFVAAKQAGIPDAVSYYQNIGAGLSGGAIFVLIMYWWQMDSTGEMQKDLKDLKKQNKILDDKLNGQATHIQALEDKLTTTNTLLQQLVDKANQSAPNALPTPANPTTNPSSN